MNFDEQAILDRVEAGERIFSRFRPLEDAAAEYVRWAANPAERVYTGIAELDAAMRGTAPGELTLIGGYTHSGKTIVATRMILNNAGVPIILFTPDETRTMVLTKLTAAETGVGAKAIEAMIQADDDEGQRLLVDTARKFAKLAVFDDTVSTVTMSGMFEEVCEAFGERPKAVIFDYARLLSGVEDMEQKIRALKAWGSDHKVAMFVISQSSRSSGAQGRRQGIDSVEYGGEALATHLITVRRKKYAIQAAMNDIEDKMANASNPTTINDLQVKMIDLRQELMLADDTVTIALVKNKRPPSELVDDMDFKIDRDTGMLVPDMRTRRTGTIVSGSATELLRERYSSQELFERGD